MLFPEMRLPLQEIPRYLERYNRDHVGEDEDLLARKKRISREGKMRRDDLYAVCRWKTPRAAKHALKNTDNEVQEITALSFATRNERIRVEVLQVLHGVSYPTASVILHFFHCETYPILDFRALWSLGFRQPSQYTFVFWQRYVERCRDLLQEARRYFSKLTMRELDRALWQYSFEHQPRSGEDKR